MKPSGFSLAPACLIALLATLACDRKVDPGEIPGTWTMLEGSREVLPENLKAVPARFVFYQDGRFVASVIPGLLYSEPESPKLDEGRGTWKLVEREGGQQIQLVFVEITAGSQQGHTPYGGQLFISKPWRTITLYYFLSDPDLGRRVEFAKK